jgi:hypothetical protein
MASSFHRLVENQEVRFLSQSDVYKRGTVVRITDLPSSKRMITVQAEDGSVEVIQKPLRIMGLG